MYKILADNNLEGFTFTHKTLEPVIKSMQNVKPYILKNLYIRFLFRRDFERSIFMFKETKHRG